MKQRIQRVYEKAFPRCKFLLVMYFRLFTELKIKQEKPPPSAQSWVYVQGGFWRKAGAALHSASDLKERAWPCIVLLAQKDGF